MPGTYSLLSNSQEEEIAKDFICSGDPDVTVVVVDSTCLERNLNLVYQTMELTSNVIVCVNLLDEAKKKGIFIDLKKLSSLLGVPVVGTNARKKKTLKNLLSVVNNVAIGNIKCCPKLVEYSQNSEDSIVTDIIEKAEYVAKSVCVYKMKITVYRIENLIKFLPLKKQAYLLCYCF